MSQTSFYHLACVSCHKKFSEEKSTTKCPFCGEAVDVHYDREYLQSRLNKYSLEKSPISGLKYLDFYPIKDLKHLVSLNEGNTPLHHAKNLGQKYRIKNLFIKNESCNPTGVFKDRGSLIELSKARELRAKAVCCASTGNMAASVAAYATIAKLPCYVFVPEGTPIGKLAQTLAYGARIIQVRGTYADCVRLCEEAAKKHHFYLAGDYAFRAEGQKSIAYEIIEQLFWHVPDVVIVPMGCGTNLSAIWKGFCEFYELGLTDKLPKMIGVQPANVPTLVSAFRQGKKRAIHVDKPQTVASAVGIGAPQDDIKALRALRDSNGDVAEASEEALLTAEQDLAHLESIFVEPSSAIPVAVIPDLLKRKIFDENSVVVCIATGTGLKDPKSATSILPDPPVIEPCSEEVDRYLESKLYEIRAAGMRGKERELWKKEPSRDDLKNIVKKEFHVDVTGDYLDEMYREVQSFHEKTEKMRKADLQYILENVLKQQPVGKKVLEISDFDLKVSKHARAEARVVLSFFGDRLETEDSGVGPVDAIINAIKKAISKKDRLKCELTFYSVEIDTKGTDAVVEVRMGLKDTHKNEVTGSATSPDVIVASINAFEKGYNLLYRKSKF